MFDYHKDLEPEATHYQESETKTHYTVHCGDGFLCYDVVGNPLRVSTLEDATLFAGFLPTRELLEAYRATAKDNDRLYVVEHVMIGMARVVYE